MREREIGRIQNTKVERYSEREREIREKIDKCINREKEWGEETEGGGEGER